MKPTHHLVLFNTKNEQLVLSIRLRPMQLMALLPYVVADIDDPQMVAKRYDLTDFVLFVEGRER